MAEEPEFATFPRFRELNTKNLLYYQVELNDLEGQLRMVEQKDWKKRENSQEGKYAKKAEDLIKSHELAPGSRGRKQWDLVIKIRERLRDYSNTHKYDLCL
jgi:hypothetical protein